jgi:hypothetical protein
MPTEKPTATNPYWEGLTADNLKKYDVAMNYVGLLIHDMRKLEEFQSTPGGPLTPSLIKAQKTKQADSLRMIQLLMPPREAFEDTKRPWNPYPEKKDRGITITADSPHTPGFISGIKEVPGISPEEQ